MEKKHLGSWENSSVSRREYFTLFYFFLNLFDFYFTHTTHLYADFVSSTMETSDTGFSNYYLCLYQKPPGFLEVVGPTANGRNFGIPLYYRSRPTVNLSNKSPQAYATSCCQ